jgi:hypothetical protein
VVAGFRKFQEANGALFQQSEIRNRATVRVLSTGTPLHPAPFRYEPSNGILRGMATVCEVQLTVLARAEYVDHFDFEIIRIGVV